MDIRKLQRAIVDGLEDVKAQHIVVLNTEHLSALFERVIIASGTSNRQTKALAASVRDSVRSRGMQVMATEGEDNGEWIIVDCGAAVVHIMQPSIREYYHLEEIWGGKPVRMKVGAIKTTLVKASEPESARPAASKRAARSAAAQPAPAKTSVRKTAAGKSATGRATASRSTAGKTAAGRTTAARTSAGRSTAAKAPAGRATAGKAAAAKAPARKTPRTR
jgi:ribosome-associated protein